MPSNEAAQVCEDKQRRTEQLEQRGELREREDVGPATRTITRIKSGRSSVLLRPAAFEAALDDFSASTIDQRKLRMVFVLRIWRGWYAGLLSASVDFDRDDRDKANEADDLHRKNAKRTGTTASVCTKHT